MNYYYELDLFRSIITLFVVLNHIGDLFIINSGNVNLANFFRVCLRISVPCFVMLSGALVLSNAQNSNYKKFFSKSIKKVIYPAILATLFYSLFYYLFNPKNIFNNLSTWILYFIQHGFFYGVSHLWFINMLLILYLFVPWLIRLALNKEQLFSYIAIFLCGLSLIVNSLWMHIWEVIFLMYLSYFMIGYIILKNKKYINLRISILAFLFVEYKLYIFYLGNVEYPSYFNFYMMLSAVSFFCIFNCIKLPENDFIKMISKESYYIYLVHAFFLICLHKIFSKLCFGLVSSPLYIIILFFSIIFCSHVFCKKIMFR